MVGYQPLHHQNNTTYPKGRQNTGNNAFIIERFNETKVSKKRYFIYICTKKKQKNHE